MSAVERLFEEFRAEHAARRAPDPQQYLARAGDEERLELETLIEAYLVRAPRRPFDSTAFDEAGAAELVDLAERSLGAASGLWPALLPRLRSRARLRRAELVSRLAEALGVGDREEKVASYYHQMERGLLSPRGVSDRVIEALSAIVGTTPEELRRAGDGPEPLPAGSAPGPAFARTVGFEEVPPAPASPGSTSAEEPWDEVDELFRGG